MEPKMRTALTEVNSILENSEEEITSKIPENFKEYVKKNMDKEFTPNIIPGLAIFAQPVSLEAKELLKLVYRDFLASNEERDFLIKKENKILKVEDDSNEKNENIKEEIEIKVDKNEANINTENKLGTNNEKLIEEKEVDNNSKEEVKEHTELIKVEEKWYQKLFTWLKKLVNRTKL